MAMNISLADAHGPPVERPRRGGPPILHQVVLKVVSPCNLNCSYCYVYHGADHGFSTRPPVISDEILGALFVRLREYCHRRPEHRVGIALHGGEPLLLGHERFASVVSKAREILGDRLRGIAVQTNGTLIDRTWAQLFKEMQVAVSISLDGPSEVHDATRVDHSGRGSHARVIAGIQLVQDAGIEPNVLCVINPRYSGRAVYRFLRDIGVQSIDFLLPDVTHDTWAIQYGHLGTTPVGDYLLEALDAWLDEDNPDVSIRLLDGLLRVLMGGNGHTDAFGNLACSYVIVETDGSIQANDALRVCDDGICATGLNVLEHGFDDLLTMDGLASQALAGAIPLPRRCRLCPERSVCGGGYLPHRYARANGFDNPSVWCRDILKLLQVMRQRVQDDLLAADDE